MQAKDIINIYIGGILNRYDVLIKKYPFICHGVSLIVSRLPE